MNQADDEVTRTAGVVVTRESRRGRQLLWAKRPTSAGFLGGFWSYAVGRVQTADADVPIEVPGPLEVDPVYAVCALRELFEETGLLVLDDGIRASWLDDDALWTAGLEAYRRGLLDEAADLGADLGAAGRRLDATRLAHLGHWRTPTWLDAAFHTEFFSLHLSGEEAAALDTDRLVDSVAAQEIERAEWIGPKDALDRWEAGRALMTTPILAIVEILADTPLDELGGALDRHRKEWSVDGSMEICGGLRILPLETQTLPPATRTNAYLLGDERFVVIDPGADDEGERARLADAVERRIEAGARLEAIVLTHHHRDHVAGVNALVAEHPAPVWAHEATRARLDGIAVDRALSDGQVVALDNHELEFLHTPGHAPGHLCIHHRNTNALLAGDLVTSKGTIVVDPPDGHMGDYLESLERIRRLSPRTIFPAHGWAITEPIALLDDYLDHRRERERSVLDALSGADAWVTPLDLVPRVYDDVARHLWPFAQRSLLAHLIHLVERGLAERRGGEFRAFTAR